ncbi:MAG TPA: hypothetical protein VJ958_03170, partial [Atribacterota bacterium]|nr:hypothetical protein [Atribacterota bacterium]
MHVTPNELKGNNHSEDMLKLCDMPRYKADNMSFTMVIFGGAGDLSQRKLIPTLYQLFINQDLIKNFSIIGLGLPEMSEV